MPIRPSRGAPALALPKAAAWAYAALLPAAAAATTGALGPGVARSGVLALTAAGLAHLVGPRGAADGADAARAWRLLLTPWVAGAAIASAIWLAAPPSLSDDVYRYLLDGRVAVSGLNPYAYAPSSPKLEDHAGALGALINHPELPTIYPPVAQGLFALNAVIGGSVIGWRLLCVALALGGAVLLQRVRPSTLGRPTAVFVATHPLVVVTAASNGNVDVAGPLLLAGALGATAASCRGIWLGLAAGTKLFPLALPAAWLGRHGWGHALRVGAVAAGLVALAYLPVAGIGSKASGSLGRYAETWEYGASGFRVLSGGTDAALALAGVDEALLAPGSASRETTFYQGQATRGRWIARHELAGTVARWLGALGLLGVAVWARRLALPPASAMVALVAWLFVSSPVVHPWYLLWLLGPAAASSSVPALAWCGVAPIGFWGSASVSDGAGWADPWWMVGVQGAVVLASWWGSDASRGGPADAPSGSSSYA